MRRDGGRNGGREEGWRRDRGREGKRKRGGEGGEGRREETRGGRTLVDPPISDSYCPPVSAATTRI